MFNDILRAGDNMYVHVSNQFRDYLLGLTFTVFTDANRLTYSKTAKLGGPSDVETVREKVIGKCPVVVVDGCSIKCLDDTGDRRIHHHRGILRE